MIADVMGDRTVMYYSRLLPSPSLNMPVKCIVTCVHLTTRKPRKIIKNNVTVYLFLEVAFIENSIIRK